MEEIHIMNATSSTVRVFFAATLLIGVMATGCKPEPMHGGPGTLTLSANFSFDGDSVLVGRTALDAAGNHLRLETFSIYLGGIELLNDTGAVRLSVAERWDAGAPNAWSYIVTPGTYSGFRVHLGVPTEYNTDTDPTIWPNDHPLGVNGSAGMFWSWNTGYIFSKFDGKADTTGGENFIHPYAFHIGGDAQHLEVKYSEPWTVADCSTHEFSLEGELLDFLVHGNDTIDVREDNVTHTGDNLGLAERYVAGQQAAVTLVKN